MNCGKTVKGREEKGEERKQRAEVYSWKEEGRVSKVSFVKQKMQH